MNRLKLYLPLMGLVFVFACKKEKEKEFPDFGQLKAGNYWVYERFDIDSVGNLNPRNEYDSCYIEKDTLINGKTYHKMVRPPQPNMPYWDIQYLRDSLHYIVDEKGNRVFSSQDFSSIFSQYDYLQGSQRLYTVFSQMDDSEYNVYTPAGNFTTKGLIYNYTLWPDIPQQKQKRFVYKRYAKEIGIVAETLFPSFNGNEVIERRLVRYKVDE